MRFAAIAEPIVPRPMTLIALSVDPLIRGSGAEGDRGVFAVIV
jgi:hypothetical protein